MPLSYVVVVLSLLSVFVKLTPSPDVVVEDLLAGCSLLDPGPALEVATLLSVCMPETVVVAVTVVPDC